MSTGSTHCKLPLNPNTHIIIVSQTSKVSLQRIYKAHRLAGLPMSTPWSSRHFDDRCTMAGSWATEQVKIRGQQTEGERSPGKGDTLVS
ncbi:hypothetical protein ElyMa_001905500 [Elysia marginata]|uniref:Uncharacterized protein n=1 Tax=Elysia marginata TaxID=1093978 RepID=A0AAV4ESL3_9GAST|nr:hypothetical protein ElyMa_001905500 [Elysia marginata]